MRLFIKSLLTGLLLCSYSGIASADVTVKGQITSVFSDAHSTLEYRYTLDDKDQLCGTGTRNWAYIDLDAHNGNYAELLQLAFFAGRSVEMTLRAKSVNASPAAEFCELIAVKVN